MRFIQYISIAFCTCLIGFLIFKNTQHYQILEGKIFGTSYKIKIKTELKNNQIDKKVKQKLDDINLKMSPFEERSEISELNRLQKNKSMNLSPEMSTVLRASNKIWQQSQGAFDPTLGKIIALWGFGPEEVKIKPSEEEIKKAFLSVGFNKLHFYKNYTKVKKTNTETTLNLSAIAKGFAVDEIALLLDKEGYSDYVVEIGGEIKTKGVRSDKQDPWTIGISKPVKNSSDNIMILSLSNIAVATSGNYRNYYEYKGKTYAHTISSKTGKPVLTDVLSVSVFHDSCMLADAYATTMMTMNVEQALKFANKYNLKVIMYDNEYKMHVSSSARDIL